MHPQTPTHVKYPETLDLRRLALDVRKYDPDIRKVPFTGTVKVHGTNITILFKPGHPPQIQSRNRIISPTPGDDSCGAAKFLMERGRLEGLGRCVGTLRARNAERVEEDVLIAGEFAGRGVQRGVGVAECEPFYVVFGVCVGGCWLPRRAWEGVKAPGERVYNILDFGTYRTEVEFGAEDGGAGQGEGEGVLVEEPEEVRRVTLEVEKECPVARGVGGVRNGVGEGVVWVEESERALERPLRFKSKGPKHRGVGRAPKVLKARSGEEVAAQERVREFVEYAVTEARMRQGVGYLREMDGCEVSEVLQMKDIPRHGKWVVEDVMKEEGDRVSDMGIPEGNVRKAVMDRAKEFFVAAVEGRVVV